MGSQTKKPMIKEPGLINLSGLSRCQRPCYIHRHKVEEGKGGRQNPYHWIVNTASYPIINIVIQFRGKAGKYFQVQVRHHHPGSSIGPTATFVFASESGNLGPAGFEMATFNGLRPMMPEVDIVAFSDDEEDFDVVAATIYATVA
ncbi:hypothetical protein ACFL5Z_14010 [Planctomycetota bacterium]